MRSWQTVLGLFVFQRFITVKVTNAWQISTSLSTPWYSSLIEQGNNPCRCRCPMVANTHVCTCKSKRQLKYVTSLLFSEQIDFEDEKIPSILENTFTEDELQTINVLANLCKEAGDDTATLRKVVLDNLPIMSPSLIVKLRQQPDNLPSSTEQERMIALVSSSMNSVLKLQLEDAKGTLLELLNAGEIRKLDNLIGAAARAGKLDVAFFNVLSANIQDSLLESKDSASMVEPESKAINTDEGSTNRASILRHIYTRCQEEVEKMIPPGKAFLNKLLRTEQQSIRFNLYKHYLLLPEVDSDGNSGKLITTPDGKTIQLKNVVSKSLIELDDFITAIDTAVLQIRTIENSGAVNNESAAQMVEACRTIAKEARIVLGERYGPDSEQVMLLQEKLQSVFRPTSPDSPYVPVRPPSPDSGYIPVKYTEF